MGLGQIKDMGTPTASTDAATKGYVDSEDSNVMAYVDTNATNWLSESGARFAYANTSVFYSGTNVQFNLNTTTHVVKIMLIGGGGGGGGVTGAGNNAGMGAGGGSGGYCEDTIAVTPGLLITYTVGVNGTAGLTTPTAGGNGAASSVTISGITYTV